MNESVDKLIKRLKIEFEKGERSGVYGFTQRHLAYNSNKIEGSKLTENQTAMIFDTGTISSDGGIVRTKDVEEMTGHFIMFNNMLKAIIHSYHVFSRYHVNLKNAKAKAEYMLSEKGSCLDRIGFLQETDKASIIPTGYVVKAAHDYLRHYDYLFAQFRQDKFSLVEFGCAEGASLRTWEQYFPNAEIYGVDLDENAKRHETDRIHIVIGDATSQETHDLLKAETGGSAFIILDDASHAWGDQRRSFELFWDILSPEGFYIVEDLECGSEGAYHDYHPAVLDAQPFSEYIHDRCKFLRWSLDQIPPEEYRHQEIFSRFTQLPKHIRKIEGEIDMCIFVPSAVIVRKKT